MFEGQIISSSVQNYPPSMQLHYAANDNIVQQLLRYKDNVCDNKLLNWNWANNNKTIVRVVHFACLNRLADRQCIAQDEIKWFDSVTICLIVIK